MLKTVNTVEFMELGRRTLFGADWTGKRCLAKNRKGNPCQSPALKGRARCRLHGGLSTGATTSGGRARVAEANTKHGRRSKAHVEKVKQIRADLRRITLRLRRAGLIS